MVTLPLHFFPDKPGKRFYITLRITRELQSIKTLYYANFVITWRMHNMCCTCRKSKILISHPRFVKTLKSHLAQPTTAPFHFTSILKTPINFFYFSLSQSCQFSTTGSCSVILGVKQFENLKSLHFISFCNIFQFVDTPLTRR